MKFLCVPCDQPMKLTQSPSSDRGSLTIVYACEECGYEMAMLTNPYETQVVQSLGVRIGPSAGGTPACPFAEKAKAAVGDAPVAEPGTVQWTADAEARLLAIPAFVRPMARTGIESFARERGFGQVDARVMDEARAHFGM